MKKETTETITKIRSNTDAAENQRRIQEEKMKKDRYYLITQFAEPLTSRMKSSLVIRRMWR